VTDRPGCQAVRAVAAELALGTLEGSERGEALAHLAGCPACQAHVQELTEVVDQLLAAGAAQRRGAGARGAAARVARAGAGGGCRNG